MIRILVVISAAALVCAPAQGGGAALCVSLTTDPLTPLARSDVRIVLRTYRPASDGLLEPREVQRYPFRVQAVSPVRRVYPVEVRLNRADTYAWTGSFRFPRSGVWTIRVTNFAPTYPKGCGEMLRVRVKPP